MRKMQEARTEEQRRSGKSGIERMLAEDRAFAVIASGQLRLADAIRQGHHDAAGRYLGATMPEAQAANTYKDLVSGVAGWY